MILLNSSNQWGLISKILHWLVALLVVAAIILGFTAGDLPLSPAKLNAYIYHKSIGLTVLLLALVRLGWKLFSPQPGAASGLSIRNQQFASLGHWFLYGLLIAVPLSGWILNSTANIPFKWMHWLAVPNLPGTHSDWKDSATLMHKLLMVTLILTVIGHAGMAVIHHYRHQSNVLSRMWPTGTTFSWALCLLIILATSTGIYFDIHGLSKQPISAPLATSKTLPERAHSKSHTDQRWDIIEGKGKLGFIGSYDGVEFNGEFRRFSAALFFDPQQPELGFFDVIVETASVTTYSEDWDAVLPEQDWFSTAAYPKASYKTSNITHHENGYLAYGKLTIKGISQPLELYFQWRPDSGSVKFSAIATVNRQDFSIGEGEWADDPTIGFEVNITVDLLLKAP